MRFKVLVGKSESLRIEAKALLLKNFVALPLSRQSSDDTPIKIKVRRGAMTVSVLWPRSTMHECGIWLREVLK